ncbi:CCR4-NOT transcription complex subunit 10-like [Xenia sp. Carnegie-2017]|uniref:CCR4-NOT transcription complex subunit 10-like n=1 Tax=Xenia sp. Carnegie-2017 TaxID=2897299 RepID=UPI001F03C596|nr:CCR4-NOT transcription complex subunit 10-like [Xenia sp. Carnegie-2017]
MASDGKSDSNQEQKDSFAFEFSDHAQELARMAFVEFKCERYDSCLSHLSKLKELHPTDLKIEHNKAVADYYRSGCKKTDDFLKTLNGVMKKMNLKISEEEGTTENVDFERALLLYNKAVYCFYVKKYVDALANLEKLLKIVEALDKRFAQNICFLYVEICLLTYQAEKAIAVLNIVEKLLHDTTKQSSENVADNGKNCDNELSKPYDQQKIRLHKYRARVHLLQKSIKACKKEIKTIMNVNNMDTEALFIKSNFEFVRHNERKAVKILNSASKDNQILKTGESISTMYFNNLGCLHAQMQKYNLASFYFCRAIAENEEALSMISTSDKNGDSLNTRPMCTLSVNSRHHLLYNLGVQMLHDCRPLLAFDCLIESVQVYQSNPRLWLRLAECCVLAHQMSTFDEKNVNRSRKSDLVESVVGIGPYRKIVLPAENTSKITTNSSGHSAAMPACNLHFAMLCLRNALVLIPERASLANGDRKQKDSSEPNGSESNSDNQDSFSSTSIPAAPSAPIKGQDIQKLKNSILANLAYVTLVLGDYVLCHEHAQTLLSQPNLDGTVSFLAHLYAAEALIQLGRVSEALGHLSIDNVSDFSSNNNGDQTPGADYSSFPQTVNEAKMTFLVNLAGAHCLREDFEKAKKCLYQTSSIVQLKELPHQALMMAVYIELQLGNHNGALMILKRYQLLPPSKETRNRENSESPLCDFCF